MMVILRMIMLREFCTQDVIKGSTYLSLQKVYSHYSHNIILSCIVCIPPATTDVTVHLNLKAHIANISKELCRVHSRSFI